MGSTKRPNRGLPFLVVILLYSLLIGSSQIDHLIPLLDLYFSQNENHNEGVRAAGEKCEAFF